MAQSKQELDPGAALFAIGVAAAAAATESFRTMDLLVTVSPRTTLTHAWLAYAALALDGDEWLFARFVPANGGTLWGGIATTFATCVPVEDYGGDFGAPALQHSVALIALSGDDLRVSFDSLPRGRVAVGSFAGERGETLPAIVRAGDVAGMYHMLGGARYLTPSTDGLLVGFPGATEEGAVRIEVAPDASSGGVIGMGLMGLFPRRG